MILSRFSTAFVCSMLSLQVIARALIRQPHELINPYKRAALQDIVTWDQYSISVHGKRIFFYSGEVHPFRLPVPGLYLDIFQKIKAIGYTGVSFYIDWALLEGQQGTFNGEGIFDLQPFFDAASQAGLYLLARPGPYVNAEASGGGFPGWLQRTEEIYRTPAYVKYTDTYASNVGAILAKNQITNGGPIILLQIENEYSDALNGVEFPNSQYFVDIEDQWRNAGIVIPFVNNDIAPEGWFSPGNISGSVDIYGHDDYPMGFNCNNPSTWPFGSLPSNFRALHDSESPNTPFAIIENQGGSFDAWGGPGYENCAAWFNMEAERVIYKNDFSFGIAIMNMYMTYGGTNWGNLGFPGVYTSYDYGAIIAEDRTISREKYSEAKLDANFVMASGDVYLTAVPTESAVNGTFVSDNSLAVTPLKSGSTMFYVVRHDDYTSTESTPYRWTVDTSQGSISIPQLSSTLTLNGRDSKIHVTDYNVWGTNMLYSSAEIFTWKAYESYKVLVLYGGAGESHEVAFVTASNGKMLEGSGVTIKSTGGNLQLNWAVTPDRKVIQIGTELFVYLLDRNDAYNYWVLDLPATSPVNNYHDPGNTAVIVRAGYLLRTATVQGSTLALTGDINTTTTIEVIGCPDGITGVSFNQYGPSTDKSSWGTIGGVAPYNPPTFSLPVFTDLVWKVIDSLPEIRPDYDDSAWVNADKTTSTNPTPFTTPTTLYGSDYGFNTGYLVYHGHFTANGKENDAGFLGVSCTGGLAFGFSAWLDDTFLGSWAGDALVDSNQQSFALPTLTAGQEVNLTVVVDQMGMEEAGPIGSNVMKTPRGIMSYGMTGHDNTDITWKITGNLGGEEYSDKARGPLNEGGLYAERFGYHLPNPPSDPWLESKPFDGIPKAGVYFYTTSFDLNIPAGYDVPLSFQFQMTDADSSANQNYRCQLYVNGYQFGKFTNNIGPQTTFPVPEGILNYNGVNYIALSLWSLSGAGSAVEGLQLISTATIQSGFGTVALSPQPTWTARPGAY